MSVVDNLTAFLQTLQDEHVLIKYQSADDLAPTYLVQIDPEDWGKAANQAALQGFRWAGMWGDHLNTEITLKSCIEKSGLYIILSTKIPVTVPVLASQMPYFPAADRMERHAQDLLGVVFSDHPDSRRWTRHLAWQEDHYPLRNDFPSHGHALTITPADGEYPFNKALGAGVNEIPVGPVHAGIIEPGHFRFQAVGEDILNLEQHLGYVHKGIEKIAVGRDAQGLAKLAARVSGDSTVAHSWAACQALERATRTQVPIRADIIRAIMVERERIANHLGDIGAICNDVAFTFGFYQCARLREIWQRTSKAVFGHRFMQDCIIPGGVTADITHDAVENMYQDHKNLRSETDVIFDICNDHPSLDDRLLTTGYLPPQVAQLFGTLGYLGKASGQDCDARRKLRYYPYNNIEVPIPLFEEGDVAARMRVRMDEIHISLDILGQLFKMLSTGEIKIPFPAPKQDCQGIGIVEGWRGEIITYVRLNAFGRVARFFPRDPSWFSWPALERLIAGNIVPDFPVCNKSVNGSYAGHDL